MVTIRTPLKINDNMCLWQAYFYSRNEPVYVQNKGKSSKCELCETNRMWRVIILTPWTSTLHFLRVLDFVGGSIWYLHFFKGTVSQKNFIHWKVAPFPLYRMGIWLSKSHTGREFGSQNHLPDENLAIKYSYWTWFFLLVKSMIILIMHGVRWGGVSPELIT